MSNVKQKKKRVQLKPSAKQVMAHLAALEAWMARRYPCRLSDVD